MVENREGVCFLALNGELVPQDVDMFVFVFRVFNRRDPHRPKMQFFDATS